MTSVAERNQKWAAMRAEWNSNKSLRDRFGGNFSKFCFWRRSAPKSAPRPIGVPAVAQPQPTKTERKTMTNDAKIAAETIREWKENPALQAQYGSVAEYHDAKVGAGASAPRCPVSRSRAVSSGKPAASSTVNAKAKKQGQVV